MMALADHIRERGGKPEEPLVYKRMYLDRLWTHIEGRIEELKSGGLRRRSTWCLVRAPCSKSYVSRGYKMYLASGTDHDDVVAEAKLLDIHEYFDGVFGAQDDLKSFSKGLLIKRIIESAEFRGPRVPRIWRRLCGDRRSEESRRHGGGRRDAMNPSA